MNIKIMISTHKPYKMPKDTSIYLPIQVGCDEVSERFGYQEDNTGDNISYKHKYYSDLSAVYWGWRNLDVEYMGTCHYRRYFVSNKRKKEEDPLFQYILNRSELEDLLLKCPVIVSRKRKYYIETIEEHYKHTHEANDFDLLRQTLEEMEPDYKDAFECVVTSRSAHLFNTFIMRKDFADDFCNFMFPVLFEVEKKIDFTGRSEFDLRACGYLAEFLLDTWIIKNKIEYQEVKLKVLEGEKKAKKIFAMVISKIFKRKYKKSF